MELARDPRFLGAQIGLLGVLQTWTRDLRYHPHIHYLVPGGGLAEDGRSWVTGKADFFVHVKPLAALFRASYGRRCGRPRSGPRFLRQSGSSPGWWIAGRSGRPGPP
jgi:hypothetical protein